MKILCGKEPSACEMQIDTPHHLNHLQNNEIPSIGVIFEEIHTNIFSPTSLGKFKNRRDKKATSPFTTTSENIVN